MYDVYLYDINTTVEKRTLHNGGGNDDRVLINTSLSEELNSSGSFSFTILPNHPEYDYIYAPMMHTLQIWDTDRMTAPVWEGRIVRVTTDQYGQKTCDCEGAMAYLSDITHDNIIYSKKTVAWVINDLLTRHNSAVVHNQRKIVVGTISHAASQVISENINYLTTLEAISSAIVSKWGGYIKVYRNANGTLVLDYTTTPGTAIDQKIVYGDNLV